MKWPGRGRRRGREIPRVQPTPDEVRARAVRVYENMLIGDSGAANQIIGASTVLAAGPRDAALFGLAVAQGCRDVVEQRYPLALPMPFERLRLVFAHQGIDLGTSYPTEVIEPVWRTLEAGINGGRHNPDLSAIASGEWVHVVAGTFELGRGVLMVAAAHPAYKRD